jgi:hypothetical protein
MSDTDCNKKDTISKKILSFDVGIKNLAFCLLEKANDKFSIHKWGIINLVDDREKCSFVLRGGKQCEKDAKVNIHHKDQIKLFGTYGSALCSCAGHKKKMIPTIKESERIITIGTNKKTKKNKKNQNEICDIKKCILCDEEAKYELSTNNEYRWCVKHYQKNGKAFEKKIVAKKISLVNCNKQPLSDLTEKLYRKLDNETSFLEVNDVLIENQPGLRNPTMKTIASILFGYFHLRGIIDKEKIKSNIEFIKFISPSNKLKIDKEKTNKVINKDDIIKNNENVTVKEKRVIYDLTKNLGKEYCKALIDENDRKILDSYKKKDDLCDSFLQGFQYLFSPVPDFYVAKLKNVDLANKSNETKTKKSKKKTGNNNDK